jgi:cob(I)alamin adenosyltransferase
MVRINRVYTKTGDDGTTGLVGGDRAPKDSLRIEAYGTVDELNAAIGLVLDALERSPGRAVLEPILKRVQNELFNLGAELATPDADRRARSPAVAERHVRKLEEELDELNDTLPELRSFVLPGGGAVSAFLHLARTICRRAERRVVTLRRGEPVGELAVTYLNRLSDALFVFGRWAAANDGAPEALWEPEKT